MKDFNAKEAEEARAAEVPAANNDAAETVSHGPRGSFGSENCSEDESKKDIL